MKPALLCLVLENNNNYVFVEILVTVPAAGMVPPLQTAPTSSIYDLLRSFSIPPPIERVDSELESPSLSSP
jgi:hypothetical protein